MLKPKRAYATHTPEERERALQVALSRGITVAVAETGLPVSTVHGYVQAYRAAHPEEVVSTPPRRAAVEMPPAIDPSEGPPAETTNHTHTGDEWTVELKNTLVTTPAELLAHCQIDPEEWRVASFTCKSYQVATVPRATRDRYEDDAGKKVGWVRPDATPQRVQLFAVAARLERKVAEIDARAEIARMIEAAKAEIHRGPLVLVPQPQSGYMLELSLKDAHLGRLAWGRETGWPNYDLGIGVATCQRAFETLLGRSAQYRYERVLFILGDDLLNSDSDTGTTTKGTPQDNDGRHFKVYQAAREMKVAMIERLARDVAPVTVVVMPGNHDRASCLHLGDSLACWFHDHPHVAIDLEPRARKYHDFGANLIGVTHGDEGKPADWARLMAVEAREAWGRTRFREVHTGHLHTDRAEKDEINGVRVRLLPSLAAPSNWESRQGFVGNLRSAEAFFWHAEEGLVGTAVYNHQD